MSDGPFSFQRSWEGFLPAGAVLMAKRALPKSGLRFAFEAPGSDDPAARALLEKIISALELAPADYAIFSEPNAAAASAIIVRFAASADEPAGEWAGNVLTTYSLRAMLGNPGLKKPVWAHLKQAVLRDGQQAALRGPSA